MPILKWILVIGGALFLLPILIAQIPSTIMTKPTQQSPNTTLPVALANHSTNFQHLSLPKSSVLIYFAHPEEAYKPVTEKALGEPLVSNKQVNIQSFAPMIKQQFELHLIETDMLKVNVAAELSAKNLRYQNSYDMIRPFVRDAIQQKSYDLVLDIHRDAVGKKHTTVTHNGISYAKLAFVIGSKHDSYEGNYAYAEELHAILQEIVPGISRGVLKKGDKGSNGIYNQDLAHNVVLIELGGIDNTEEELERTVAILGRAIAKMFQNEQLILLNE